MNLNAVIHQLQTLDLAQPTTIGPEIQAYLEHYQLDFVDALPGVHHHVGTFDSGNYEIAGQLFLLENARATVFVVHGYTDHVGLYGGLIRHLLEQQFSVAVFDLPGHGLSTGEAANITSFSHYDRALEDFMRQCEGHVPTPWYALGQSTGAAAVMSLLLRDPSHPFQKTVLLAPLVRPHNWVWLKWVHLGLYKFIRRLPRDFKENSHDLGFLNFIRKHDPLQVQDLKVQWITAMNNWMKWFISLPPSASEVLAVQGEGDDTVDWRYNLDVVHAKFPRARILRLPNAKHHLARESSRFRGQVFDAIDSFFDEADASSPSATGNVNFDEKLDDE